MSGITLAERDLGDLRAVALLAAFGARTRLRALFDAFEVPDLPQIRKRAELARRALAAAAVTPADLGR